MCKEVICNNPAAFFLIPDRFKTQEMCIKAVDVDLWQLWDVPDDYKLQEMCDAAVREDPSFLIYVPDWFLRQQQVNMWYDDYYNDDNYNQVIGWHNGCQKRMVQKAKIKEDLMPIVWHPLRWWDWCVPEDEKEQTEELWKQQIVVFNYLIC